MGCIHTVKVRCAEWWWGVFVPLRLDVLSVVGCIRTVKVRCAEWWRGGGVFSTPIISGMSPLPSSLVDCF